MTCACSSLLASIGKEFLVAGLRVEFSKRELSSQSSGLSSSDDVHGMLEGIDDQCLDKLSPFICAYADNGTGYNEDPRRTKVNTKYSELLFEYYRTTKRNPYLKAWMS